MNSAHHCSLHSLLTLARALAVGCAARLCAQRKVGHPDPSIDTRPITVVATIATARQAARHRDLARTAGTVYVSDQPATPCSCHRRRDAASDRSDRARRIAGRRRHLGRRPLARGRRRGSQRRGVRRHAPRRRVSVRVPGQNPEHAVFTPDGTLGLRQRRGRRRVDVIDVAARKQVARSRSARGRAASASRPTAARLGRLRELERGLRDRHRRARRSSRSITAGLRSNGVAVQPDGARVYVSNGGDASVSVIDAATLAVIATIPVGQRPWNMALTPGRQQALRRLRALGHGVGHRHRRQDADRRRPGRQAAVGRRDPLSPGPAAGIERLRAALAAGAGPGARRGMRRIDTLADGASVPWRLESRRQFSPLAIR